MSKQSLLETVVYKPVAPFPTKVLETRLLTPEGHDEEVRHIIIELSGSGLHYTEGQSLGVIAPGLNEKGKPHQVRLYSIASARCGDEGHPGTVSLCVKRVVEKKEDGSVYRGVASNHLCDLRPGDPVLVTGPVGKAFVLPEDPSVDLIFIATGTGIAPYRAFIEYIRRVQKNWTGTVWLIMGARNQKELIYMNAVNDDMIQFMKGPTCRIDTTRSREEKTADGSRLYVQHRLREHLDDLKKIVQKGNMSVYICGLKGMEEGIESVFREALNERNWDEVKQEYRLAGRWNIETY